MGEINFADGRTGRRSRLLGTWTVEGEADVRVLVTPRSVHVQRSGGLAVFGFAASNGGAFLTQLSTISSAGGQPIDIAAALTAMAYVTEATGWRSTDAGWESDDAHGHVVGRFVRAQHDWPWGVPLGAAQVPGWIAERPAIGPAHRPVDSASVAGCWVPTDDRLGFVLFSADGQLLGDDGGNRSGGRWVVDAQHELLLTPQLTTSVMLIIRPHVDLHQALVDAAQIAFAGDELVCLNSDDTVTERLQRGRAPAWAIEQCATPQR